MIKTCHHHPRSRMINKLLAWLFPITCMVCTFASKTAVCANCLPELPWIKQSCLSCATELTGDTPILQCGECLLDPPFSLAVILFHYALPISSLITKLKFQHQLRYAQPLGVLLAERIAKTYQRLNLSLPECIIPVPLHLHRLRARGYNQAMEIARPMKERLSIPIDYKSVARILPTAPQTLISASDRQANVKNAFTVDKHFAPQHVAIVDDVATTFSTLRELATTLKKQGVKHVDAWCIAKATPA